MELTSQGFSKKEAYKSVSALFLVTLAGSLLPLIFSVLIAVAFSRWQGWLIFLDNGEFYLYSAGFLIQSVYMLFSLKSKRTPGLVDIFFWLCAGALLFAAFFYAALVTSLQFPVEYNIHFNRSVLYFTSLGFFTFSLLGFCIAAYKDYEFANISIPEESQKGIESLIKGLK